MAVQYPLNAMRGKQPFVVRIIRFHSPSEGKETDEEIVYDRSTKTRNQGKSEVLTDRRNRDDTDQDG